MTERNSITPAPHHDAAVGQSFPSGSADESGWPNNLHRRYCGGSYAI